MKVNNISTKPALSAPVLGKREIETLGLFWRDESIPLSASDILKMCQKQSDEPDKVISINTIQSTIERLWRKKLLSRHKKGKAYIYESTYSKQEVISSLIKEISDALGQGDENAIMSGIFTFLKSRNTNKNLNLLEILEQDPVFTELPLTNVK
jgi:predicted transcriptional regulator